MVEQTVTLAMEMTLIKMIAMPVDTVVWLGSKYPVSMSHSVLLPVQYYRRLTVTPALFGLGRSYAQSHQILINLP